MVITRATNVWIKFVPFIINVCENFSFVNVSYENVIVSWLQEIYRANTIVSSIFFVGGPQAPILRTAYHEKSLREELTHFWSEGIDKFMYGGIETIWNR